MHLKPLPQLGYFPTKRGKHVAFDGNKGHISKTLCTKWNIMQLIPFVHAFYAFEYPLFYNIHNRESDVTVFLFTMETRQGDPLGRALFALTHFKTLCSIASHLFTCLFLSIINDTHIIGPLSITSFTYEHFQTKFRALGIYIQPHKCVAWSPFSLLFNFNTPSQFTTPSKGIKLL